MLQLQVLEVSRTEEELVSVEATTRAELIQLMARILVTVFQQNPGERMNQLLCSPKIKPEHLARKAIVYLRQSSERQVARHYE